MFTNNPKARAGLYAVAIAVLGILGVYGLVTDAQAAAFANLAGAAVALLAFTNVPKSGDE